MKKEIRNTNFLDFSKFHIITSAEEALPFFRSSTFLSSSEFAEAAQGIRFEDGKLIFPSASANSYFASVAADFLRQKLVKTGQSFTFETVMSHESKVEILATARAAGYRTYLYYIATDDPAINVSRVRGRVELGGHDVPTDKILSRYGRSLELLKEAIKQTNRAYIFDNSAESPQPELTLLAEITEGRHLELKSQLMPKWFKRSVWDKISTSTI